MSNLQNKRAQLKLGAAGVDALARSIFASYSCQLPLVACKLCVCMSVLHSDSWSRTTKAKAAAILVHACQPHCWHPAGPVLTAGEFQGDNCFVNLCIIWCHLAWGRTCGRKPGVVNHLRSTNSTARMRAMCMPCGKEGWVLCCLTLK